MLRLFDDQAIVQDASLITWSHAVNSKAQLDESLKSKVKFLEADILFIEDRHTEPVMAHPPQIDSDLRFSQWLNASLGSGKGLKLDFKSANSLLPCLFTLNSLGDKVSFTFFYDS